MITAARRKAVSTAPIAEAAAAPRASWKKSTSVPAKCCAEPLFLPCWFLLGPISWSCWLRRLPGLIETWWVSHLGTDALAGMALVFPVVMLMQMVSAGAMGGGISSAVARALGGGRRDEADALVLHAIVVNVALGGFFSIVMLVFGPSIYRALGGTDGELQTALSYSNVVFAGNILLWLMNALASVIRGTGNMLVPAMVISAGVVRSRPALALSDLRGWSFPRAGRSRSRRGTCLLLCGGNSGSPLVHSFRTQRGAFPAEPSSLAAVSRYFGRRRRRRSYLVADKLNRGADHSVGRQRLWELTPSPVTAPACAWNIC